MSRVFEEYILSDIIFSHGRHRGTEKVHYNDHDKRRLRMIVSATGQKALSSRTAINNTGHRIRMWTKHTNLVLMGMAAEDCLKCIY
ncbi:hypothetical protein TNCV_315451 [Trichonephila clavipes]|nr:hypothetical protein TNCV_315451 [Trichonephila clavipes]